MIRRLTDAERELWERVRRSIRPLRLGPRAAEAGRSPTGERDAPEQAAAEAEMLVAAAGARGPRRRRSEPAAQANGAGVAGAARPPSIDPRLRRGLARGAVTIDGRLDLHGLDQQAAIRALESFLRARQAAGDRMVLVITGKGRAESGAPGILRRQVPHWLSLPRFRDVVAGCGEAGRRHGGGGALYIRLRRSRGQR